MATKTKAAKATKKTVNKTVETVETETLKATAILRKGFLAFVGLHGAAYEDAQARFEKARKSTDGLFDKLVARGEKIEADAKVRLEDVQDIAADNAEKIKASLPKFANDRIVELEARFNVPAKKSTKTVKTAKKTTAKKTTAKKAPAKKATRATKKAA